MASAALATYFHLSTNGTGYFLYRREQTLRNGERTIYFFAKKPSSNGEACGLPEGFCVVENPVNGLPMLKRISDSKPSGKL
jgi:hypothetical protein